jgi:hypothetical protein
MALSSSLLGAALGFGLGGNGQSAALGAAAGYAVNKFSHHQPLFGGACGEGRGHSPVSGHCIRLGGKAHASLVSGYSERQMEAMEKAIEKAESLGHAKSSREMKLLVSRAIRDHV